MASELAVESHRFAEEGELLKHEIGSFLTHYKDVVIPSLKKQEEELKKELRAGEKLTCDKKLKYCLRHWLCKGSFIVQWMAVQMLVSNSSPV